MDESADLVPFISIDFTNIISVKNSGKFDFSNRESTDKIYTFLHNIPIPRYDMFGIKLWVVQMRNWPHATVLNVNTSCFIFYNFLT